MHNVYDNYEYLVEFIKAIYNHIVIMQIYQVVYIKSDKPNVPPDIRSIYPRVKVIEPTLTVYSNRDTNHYFGYIICMYVMYRHSQIRTSSLLATAICPLLFIRQYSMH